MLNDYYMIPTKVMKGTFEIDGEVRRLTSNEKILYAELIHCGMENAHYGERGEDARLYCTVKQGDMAEDIGVSRMTINRLLKILTSIGLVEIVKSDNRGVDTYYVQTLKKS